MLTTIFKLVSYLICAATIYLAFDTYKKHTRWTAGDTISVKTTAKTLPFANLPWLTYERVYTAAFWLIAFVAIFARVYKFWIIPYGLNQDEASIGYDSYAIGNYGYDRNGFHLPVYPIAFGDGHGPLYTYLQIPAVRILGLSIFSIRITNVLLSCIAVFLMYFLIRRITKSRAAALIGFGVAATAPVLIVAARWSLDGCPPPSLFVIALYLFVRAIDSQKTISYAIAAGAFALLCYSYGPAAIVAVIFIIFMPVYLLYHKKLTFKQLAISAGVFIVILAPMAVFMLRNMLDLPAINAFISFPRFTVMRTTTVMQSSLSIENFISGIKRVVFQPQDLIWNTVPGFGTTYLFTAPLIIFGTLVLCFRAKLKTYNHYFVILAYAIASILMSGLISQNVNRISVVYPAAILLIALAIHAVWKQKRIMAGILCAFVLLSFASFAHDYYGEKYKNDFGHAFFYSFGDALEFAMEKTDGVIYVTETNQSEPSVITLFYSKLPPEKFYNTVKYYDDYAEFRNAMYFDRFIFGTPADKDSDAVYVIDNSEIDQFDPGIFNIQTFTYYSVMYPK